MQSKYALNIYARYYLSAYLHGAEDVFFLALARVSMSFYVCVFALFSVFQYWK